MFRWWRRNDGFEWHKYVRTTIKIRRQDRDRRIKKAQAAALDGLKDVGRAGVAAGREGLAIGGRGLQGFAVRARDWIARLAVASAHATLSALRWSAAAAGAAGVAALGGIGRLGLAGRSAAALAAALVGLLVTWALGLVGPDMARTGLTIGLAAAAVIAACTLHVRRVAGVLPGLRTLAIRPVRYLEHARRSPRQAAAGLAAAVALGVAIVLASSYWSSVGHLVPIVAQPAKALSGRATAVDGGRVRVDGAVVQLAGIEAPLPSQTCALSGRRRWPCGAGARSALARLVARGRVTCEARPSPGDVLRGTCRAGDVDVGRELVRSGAVFAASGLVSDYGAEESEARAARRGLWRTNGGAERPADYRARLWQEAKREAPQGCPIKGRVNGGSRTYLRPWDPGYERARVREGRGERWFCSEQDAAGAGFRAASG